MGVPGRPGPAATGHQADIGVQNGGVFLVGETAEDLPLGRRGVGDQAQGGVGVTSQHDFIEAFFAVGRDHRHTAVDPADPAYGGIGAQVRQGPAQTLRVGPRATNDRVPLGPIANRIHAVVVDEAGEKTRGEF